MAAITITTQGSVFVPDGVSTLLLASNVMARYRRIEMLTPTVLFLSIDGSPAMFGRGIPLYPFRRTIEWLGVSPADDIPNMDMFAFHRYTAAPVIVNVIEG